MNFTFSFSTRQKYLLEKRRWSEAYKQQAQLIRDAKLGVKAVNREFSRGNKTIYEVWVALRALADRRQEITDLLTVRGAMVKQAQEQYSAQKKIAV